MVLALSPPPLLYLQPHGESVVGCPLWATVLVYDMPRLSEVDVSEINTLAVVVVVVIGHISLPFWNYQPHRLRRERREAVKR